MAAAAMARACAYGSASFSELPTNLASTSIFTICRLAPVLSALAPLGRVCQKPVSPDHSGRLQQVQYGRGLAEEVKSAAIGGDMLFLARARAEDVAEFIVASTEPLRGKWTLEPAHRSIPAFDAA